MSKSNFRNWLDHLDLSIVRWLARYSLPFLRFGMGLVFLWFGALKFFPALSPATDLAVRTIDVLTIGLLPASVSLLLLASLETAIGLGFLTGRYMRLTLEGQYIIKNVVLIGAGLVIGATVRGGRIVADPQELHERPSQLSPQPVRLRWRQQSR